MTTTSPVSLSLPYRVENKRFSTLKRTKTGGIQPKLNVACFVQSCLTDADFVILSNYCLIGTRLRRIFCFIHQYYLSSQLLTSYVVALKNADSEFTEQSRGYAFRISFKQFVFTNVRADYHTLFGHKPCIE